MLDFKKSIKLLGYSISVKRQIIVVITLLLVGIGIEIGTGCSYILGGFYITLVGCIPGQMLILMSVPNAVKASPHYHEIMVKWSAILNFLCELICYTIVVLIHGAYAALHPQRADVSMSLAFIVAITVGVTQILYPLMYKHYWISFGLIMVIILRIFTALGGYIFGAASLRLSFAVYVIGGYALVILGMFGGMLVNHIFYKHELDPMAYKSMMKKIDGSM